MVWHEAKTKKNEYRKLKIKQEGRVLKVKEKGKSSIENQTEKLLKNARQNSILSRIRYKTSCRQFAKFANEKFKLQNLKNITEKHVIAFSKYRQEQGIAPKTLKNDLTAVRYMHAQLSLQGLKMKTENLPANAYLKDKHGIQFPVQRQGENGNRAWTREEYVNAIEYAQNTGKTDYAALLQSCREMGLRIAEAMCMSRLQAANALKTGVYHVAGEAKNGMHRDIPLPTTLRPTLERLISQTPRGEKIFVDFKTTNVKLEIGKIEQWLETHAAKFETEEGRSLRSAYKKEPQSLNFHGLRYNYAQDRMQERQSAGLSFNASALETIKEMGHNRIGEIYTYLR